MKIPELTPDLIADLYDTALDEDAWPQFAAHVGRALGVEGAAAVLMERGQVVGLSVTEPMQRGMADYQNYYQDLDPWRRAGSLSAPNTVVLSSELFPEDEFIKTEFYNDHARHLGMMRPMNVYLPLTSTASVAIGVEQPFAKHLAESGDKIALARLAPYLKRALQLRCRLIANSTRTRLSAASLDALAIGMIVCKGDGQIVFANAMAERLHREQAGIVLGRRKKGIGAARSAEAAELRRLIHDAAKDGNGGAVSLTGADDKGPLVVLVTPLPRAFIERSSIGCALVALRRMSDDASFSDEMLGTLFKLSPMQASLAVALFNGESVESYAAGRGVKVSTVRTHLAEIFAKTGMESQRDLVRLLGTLPPLR